MSRNSNESCEEIERYLKSVLFTKEQNVQPKPFFEENLILQNADMTTSLNSFNKDVLIHPADVNYPPLGSTTSLIDNEALLRFAAAHLQDPNTSTENFPELVEPGNSFGRTEHLFDKPILRNSVEENCNDVGRVLNSLGAAVSPNKQATTNAKKVKKRRGNVKKKKIKPVDRKHTKDEFEPRPMDEEVLRKLSELNQEVYHLMSKKKQPFSVSKNVEERWCLECYMCNNFVSTNDLPNFPHFNSATHKKKARKLLDEYALEHLPQPLPAQIEVISNFIHSMHTEFGMSEEHVKQRKFIVTRVNELITEHLPGYSAVLTGSSVSGCGLKSSDVDIVLRGHYSSAPEKLAASYKLLSESNFFKDVQNQFQEKYPKVTFKDAEFNLPCQLMIDPQNTLPMASMFESYANLDPRVAPLATAFKYFAQLCELNDPEIGTLPSFSFVLLLIYFLQQQNPPILPALPPDQLNSKGVDCETFKSDFQWKSENSDTVGSLWLKLFKFYYFEFEAGHDVVSVCSSTLITCKEKNWGTKFLAIEEPFYKSRNLARCVPNKSVFTYVMDCFLGAYTYFAHPQLVSGQINAKVIEGDTYSSTSPNSEAHSSNDVTRSTNDETLEVEEIDVLEDHDAELPFDDVISTISKLTIDDITINEDADADEISENFAFETKFLGLTESLGPDTDLCNINTGIKNKSTFLERPARRYCWDIGDSVITTASMVYEFRKKTLTMQQELPMVCRLCLKPGHVKNTCPEEYLPEIKSLPRMTRKFLGLLTDICQQIMRENQLSQPVIQDNEKAQLLLLKSIQEIYPDAELELFGSFCNGFGFANSDLDLCLTFKSKKTGEGLNTTEIIETLAKKLKTLQYLMDVVAIVTAKVPIVKFFNRKPGVQRECDISLYNTLAQCNTKMLQAYCSIDPRVRIMGYVIKYFAKVLDICDASRGSLSSYAYIVMAIFFLQQRNPPVVPVLQELYTGEKPSDMVDNCNVWFFKDLDRLKEVWPEYNQNNESIGDLWIGLLKFYAAEFDWKEYVVSIKQKSLLTRFSKMWTSSKKITIEDPFELTHNLGAGLSRRMSTYIITSFIYAREHFGTPVSNIDLRNLSSSGAKDYLFNRNILSRGCAPPNDKGCRNCGKIGHVYKNCPNLQPKRYRADRDRQDKRVKHSEKIQNQKMQDTHHNRKDQQQPRRNQHEYLQHMDRHQEPVRRYQQAPGFGLQLPNMGQMHSPRPMTSSPFPSNASNVFNHPLMQQQQSSTQNLWPRGNQRSDNFQHTNNANGRWKSHSIPQQNHGLDQSGFGASSMIRAPGMPYPSGHSSTNQDRPRTNSNPFPHKW